MATIPETKARPEPRQSLLAAGLLLLSLSLPVVLPGPVAAQGRSEAPPPSDREIIERILELRAELDRLLQALSPEGRRALERRLAEAGPEGEKEGGTPVGDEGGTPEASAARGEEAAATAAEPAAGEHVGGEPGGDPGAGSAKGEEVAGTTGGGRSGGGGSEGEGASPPAPRPGLAGAVPPEPRGPGGGQEVQRCNTLALLDTREDGVLDARDRYWRYLYLWRDGNRDGAVQEAEVRSLYEEGVRSLGVGLETFGTEGDGVGLVRLARWIVLDVGGNGFAGTIAGNTDDGALVVDATALSRGSGPELLDPQGETLEGYQPFRSLLRLRLDSGEIIELSCPN